MNIRDFCTDKNYINECPHEDFKKCIDIDVCPFKDKIRQWYFKDNGRYPEEVEMEESVKEFRKKEIGIIDFGKFKGRKWSNIPIDYLKFLISDKCETHEANKTKADKELKQRTIIDGQFEMNLNGGEHEENKV